MGVIEDYTKKAIAIANDNSHGYSQQNRWGPDYDCSSLVIQCLQDAGIPAKDRGATFTGNMREVLLSCGFRPVTVCNLSTGSGMRRGDILLHDQNHTAIYIGNGQLVHARSSEGNTLRGDQSGNEIRVQPYYNYPWSIVLRYAEPESAAEEPAVGETPPEPAESPAEEPKPGTPGFTLIPPVLRCGMGGPWAAAMQGALVFYGLNLGPWGVDGEFGTTTETALRNFQTRRGLPADGVCGPKTWAALLDDQTED